MSDLISRVKAIEALERAKQNIRHNIERAIGRAICEILDEVENGIKQLPPAEHGTNLAEVGTDCISREQAIDAVRATLLAWSYMPEWRDNKIIEAVEQLPTIQPKRGRWIDKGVCTYVDNCRHLYKCDQCGGGWLDTPDFCPNCGADMRGEQDGL